MPAVPLLRNPVDLVSRPGDPRYFRPAALTTKGFYNNSEGGTNTTTITTGNSGGLSGNAYDAATAGTGNTLTYATAAAYRGSLGIQAVTPSVTNNSSAQVAWKSSLLGTGNNGVTQIFARMFFQCPTSFPLASTIENLIKVGNAGSNSLQAKITITPAGNWQLLNTASAASWTSTNTLSTGVWYRLEWWSTYLGTGGTNGRSYTAMYVGDSLTPLETHVDSLNTGAGTVGGGQLTFGASNNQITGFTLYMDELWGSTGNFPPVYLTYTIPADPSAGTGDVGAGADAVTKQLVQDGTQDAGTGADAATIAATISDSDSASGADTAKILVSSADTGSGTETASLTLTGTETGTGTESTPSVALSAAETASGADAATILASFSDTDTGTGADAATIKVSDTDAASAAEAASEAVTLSGAETGTGTEGIPSIALSTADIMSGADTATLVAHLSDADTGTGDDEGSSPGGHPVSDTDAGSGADAATITARFSSADTISGLDASSLTADVTGAEAGSGADTGSLAASLADAEAASGSEATHTGLSATDSSSGAESVSLLAQAPTDTLSGSESVTSLGIRTSDTLSLLDQQEIMLSSADLFSGVDAFLLSILAGDSASGADAGTPPNARLSTAEACTLTDANGHPANVVSLVSATVLVLDAEAVSQPIPVPQEPTVVLSAASPQIVLIAEAEG